MAGERARSPAIGISVQKITSPQNPVVKRLRSLERGRARREQGLYVAEGVRLVAEAVGTGQDADIALYDPAALTRSEAGTRLMAALPGWARTAYEADARVLAAAAQTDTPAGVVVALRFPSSPPLPTHRTDRLGIVLDHLADPGNAGTILRTAAAAGVGYVVTTPGTVDLFAPKVVRAGMGAHFRLPLYPFVLWEQIETDLAGVALVVAAIEGGTSVFDLTWPPAAALVVGSEAHGLSAEARGRAGAGVHIPMRPGVESLNASVAASIIMYMALGPWAGRE
jgi:TrmH family RNA methyltransferase